jgi:hypothetical protein
MFFSGLMVANAFDYQWFANEDHWAHQVDTVGTRRALSELTAGNVISDLVSDDRTTRTSQFRLDIENLEVQLVQEAPVAGFNFVQSYQLTNSGTEPVSANIVWYADADLAFEQDPFAANVPNDTNPRTYFIEESDVGEGDPSVDDRERRIRCGSKPVHE